jgi:phosphatidylglycerophosphate synthase
MFDHSLRPHRDRLLRPAARALGRGVAPNLVSAAAFGAGMGCAAFALHQHYVAALVMWGVNRLLDGLDGALAREHDRASDFGAYLDLLLDFVVYAAIPIALVMGRPDTPGLWAALAVMLAAFYVNSCSWMYPSVIAAARTAESETPRLPPGLVEGAETAVIFTLFFIFPAHLNVMFLAMAILLGVAVMQRVMWMAGRARE